MQLFGPSAITNTAQAQAQAASGSSSSGSSSASSVSSLTSEQTFLQLLVAQIQNQDPLNPTDSIQFVGQLVQYSELEQLMGINQGVQSLAGSTTTTSPSGRASTDAANKTSSL
jgi:flagellar basal-body rod modification protein FlgD